MKTIRMLLWIIVGLAGLFVLVSSYLYFQQDNMVFIPMKDIEITPDQINLAYEDVYIDVDDNARINVWYFPGSDSTRTVLFCHGNAGNMSHRLETVRFLQSLGAGVLLFDYRGYGLSTGSPSEEGVYADAVACYRWLLREKQLSPSELVIFGRSLGGAVAVELALNVECASVIVESSFTSVPDLGRRMFPYLPVSLILKYEFNTVDKIGQLKVPTLVAHSSEDDIVPFDMGERLFEAATEPRQFLTLAGGHNDLTYLYETSYTATMKEYLSLDGDDKGTQPPGDPMR